NISTLSLHDALPISERRLQPSRLPRPGARRPARPAALRPDRRRQRLLLVHHRRTRPALERRRPESPEDRARLGLRGGAERAHPARLSLAALAVLEHASRAGLARVLLLGR